MSQWTKPGFVLALLLLSACDNAEKAKEADRAADTMDTTSTMEVLATGSNIAGANGVYVGPDGYLYVASVVGSDITVIDPETGKEIKRYTEADGVNGPDDLAFAPDGAFYWTSFLTGEVAGFTKDGKRVVAAQLSPGVNPITFSDDGRLFIAQCFTGVNVYELDPAGQQEPRLISDSLGPGCGLNGMDWGPDGRLYGPRWFTGEVVSFDVDDNTMRVEASGFGTPAAVKFNSRGELHVLDTKSGEVVKVTDGKKQVLAKLDPGLDNFAFDKDDRIFVSSFADGFVKRVNKDGSITELQPGGICNAGGITIWQGHPVIADLHAIRSYYADSGQPIFTERNVLGVGEMGGALNLASDGENLILVSWFDGDVRVWDPIMRKRLARYGDLSMPVAAVRYHDGIAVAEHGKHRVVVLSDAGESVIASDLPAPTGLVVDQGDLYVSDRARGQILMIASDGKPMDEPYVVADDLDTPEGFVLTPEGFVVIEADPGRVTRINSAGDRQVLARMPPGRQATSEAEPPSMVFNGIAATEDGTLFVTGEMDHVLYRITP